jgi:putative CocE/NonD family hydrolase
VGRQEPDQFVYDPLDVMSAEEYFAHPPNILNPNWLTEGSGAYESNILIYHSPPLATDIDVAGVPVFRAYIELNVPDTDFHVRLFEVRPDGAVIWLGETYGRARYRNSRATPELVEPGTVQPYEFKDFLFVARRIPKGSRLQLILSGLNRPDYQKNYNSGGDIAWETAEDAQTAVIRLHHDERYPSALELPVWE